MSACHACQVTKEAGQLEGRQLAAVWLSGWLHGHRSSSTGHDAIPLCRVCTEAFLILLKRMGGLPPIVLVPGREAPS